jgi:hypothetical protein
MCGVSHERALPKSCTEEAMEDRMTPHERELYEERAGIIQFCGNVPKAEAEQLAEREWKEKRETPLQRSLFSLDSSA